MSKLYMLFSHVSLKWKKIFRATHSRLRRINSLFNSNIYKKGFAPESMSRNVTYLSLKAWNTFLSILNRFKQNIYIYSSMVADESKHRSTQQVELCVNIPEVEGGKQCVKWVGWKRKWQHEPSTLEWLRIKDGVCLEIINMTIIIKTDTDSSCGFCGRFALLPLNYTFVLARMSLRDFFLFANRWQVLWACISKV